MKIIREVLTEMMNRRYVVVHTWGDKKPFVQGTFKSFESALEWVRKARDDAADDVDEVAQHGSTRYDVERGLDLDNVFSVVDQDRTLSKNYDGSQNATYTTRVESRDGSWDAYNVSLKWEIIPEHIFNDKRKKMGL